MEESVRNKVLTVLGKYKLLGLDTIGFIYHFEKNDYYLPFTRALFSSIEAGNLRGVTSIITLLEILVKPKKEENDKLVKEYEILLKT